MVYEMVKEEFPILKIEKLTQEQAERVQRKVRGGNWIAHNGAWVIAPKIAVICYDYNPVTVDENNAGQKNNYPNVENENIFHKHNIRSRLAKIDDTSEKVFGIHGSDNAYEAQHMLHEIYAANVSDVNHGILEEVQKHTV